MRIINVMAMSLDGKIASHPGEKDEARRALGFTNEDDRQHVESLLAAADAVILGASSLRASGRAWEVQNDRGVLPTWVVLSREGLQDDLPFWNQSCPKWIVTQEASSKHQPPEASTTRHLVYGQKQPAKLVVGELRKHGMHRVLLFGGGEINRLFYEEKLVDELILTVCPLLLGKAEAIPLVSSPLASPVRFELVASHAKGNLVFLNYRVLKD